MKNRNPLLCLLTCALVTSPACNRSDGDGPLAAAPPVIAGGAKYRAQDSDGGWISSGGELIGDGHNPWFLSNVAEIRYCLQLDPNSFSASEASTTNLIERAFGYWEKEFERIGPIFRQPIYVPMGKNHLKKIACDGSEDVTFLAGFSQLNKDQRRLLKRPKSLLALAVRTNYDPVQLRGKGFVFISSDLGEDAYKVVDGAATQPWSQDKLLYRVLLHEIGHVFGIPHTDHESGLKRDAETDKTSIQNPLMQENFPEYVVSRPHEFESLEDVPPFFGYLTEYESCKLTKFAREFFKLAPEQTCLKIQTNSKVFAEIYARSDRKDATATLIGTVPELEKENLIYMSFELHPVIKVRITPEQKALNLPKGFPNTVDGPGLFTLENTVMNLVLAAEPSRKIPVYFRLEPHRIVMMAADERGAIKKLLD